MGTNYYLKIPKGEVCTHCGRFDEDESLHIGKSSYGWVFSLHVMPEREIHDLVDWRVRWTKGIIQNEYGDTLRPEDMERIIIERKIEGSWVTGAKSFDQVGYDDEADFHARNHSQRGPNGLLRSKIDGRCIKHGEGTWDCFLGEFS